MSNVTLDNIKRYLLSPEKYGADNKNEVNQSINELNKYLATKDKSTQSNNIFNELCDAYTSQNGKDNSITETMYKTIADEGGLSATKLYKEIYFNEIIQNANDLPDVNEITIVLEKNEKNYCIRFEYSDKGFSVKDIIGFFNTEMHTKKSDLSSTGKHGVGIKSLFYFINRMTVRSNVSIDYSIDVSLVEEVETINNVSSSLKLNENWDEKTTTLTITFDTNKKSNNFNIAKLKSFIDAAIDGKDVSSYFFSTTPTQLLFDARGLLFTDKNKGKTNGIKTMIFKPAEKKPFSLSCVEDGVKIIFENTIVKKSTIKFNEEDKVSYICFTVSDDDKKTQNFTVAFPANTEFYGNERYYDTYYIPNENQIFNLNVLINSGYSNISRTKLTDDDNSKKIISVIQNNFLKIYKAMCSETVGTSALAVDISKLFHRLVMHFCDYDEESIIDIFNADVNNRYLPKFKIETQNQGKYIVYKRQQKEKYEKKLIGQKVDKEALKKFYNDIIVCDDSIPFDETLFIEEVKAICKRAYDEGQSNYQLKAILNIVGNIRDLFFYRIIGKFPEGNNRFITEYDVDCWHKDKDAEFVKTSFTMFGRYRLNQNINMNGEITSASFYEYLFNDNSNISTTENKSIEYKTFKAKQDELYKDYAALKEQLYTLLVNRDSECTGQVFLDVGERSCKENCWCKSPNTCKGYICFYGSTDNRASAQLYYCNEETYIFDHQKNIFNSDTFDHELTAKLIDKIISDESLKNSLILFKEKLVIRNSQLPNWGRLTTSYWRTSPLVTGKQFKCRLINVNFLRNVYAHSFEEFKYYYDKFFSVLMKEEFTKFTKFSLFTCNDSKLLFDFNVNDLPEIFQFFYPNLYKYNGLDLVCHFKIKLTSECKTNLCDEQFFQFIQVTTGKEIFITQTNNSNNRKNEIMYLSDNNISFMDGENIIQKGNYTFDNDETTTNKIYIVCGTTITAKEAIIKVLEKVLSKNDIIEFCKAFISTKSISNATNDEYSKLKNNDFCINQYSRIINRDIKISLKRISYQGLLKLILARGNNNGRCSCCGKTIDYRNAELAITTNDNNCTKQDYPQIYTATCSECHNILRKCLYSAKISDDNSNLILSCNAQTGTQSKDIVFKSNLSDGNLKLFNGVSVSL